MGRILVYLALSLPTVGAIAMFSLGIVVMYRASRVLNLAHGAMAMVPAYIADSLARTGAPAWVWLPLGVASGAVLGVIVQRVFVHTLRSQSSTGQTVGTVAAFGLLVAIAIRVWKTTPRVAHQVFPQGEVGIGSFGHVRYGEIGLAATALVAALALLALFRYTHAGRAMQATADSPRGAALVGIDPERSTQRAWAIGGALAALAGILLAAVSPPDPIHLAQAVLPAFVAALIGGLDSIPGALAGAAVVGIAQGMVPAISLVPGIGGFAKQLGAPQLVIAIIAFVVMMLRGKKLSLAQAEPPTSSRQLEAEQVPHRWSMTPRARLIAIALVAVALIAWPYLHAPFSLLTAAGNAGVLVMISASLVMLTGWVGQISLAQASFVGVGAFTTALALNRAGIDFPYSVLIAAVAAGGVAALLGVVALRVRGLYLAVATLIFVWMANEYLFRTPWFAGGSGGAAIQSKPIGHAGSAPYFNFTDARTFYFLALAGAAAVVWALSNIRDSKSGRAFFAVRGSEVAAASLGINVTRTKLAAFSISGAIAGAAGCFIAVGAGAVSLDQFELKWSLFYLAVAVVGGLQNLSGAVAAALLFAGLEEIFYLRNWTPWIEIVSSALLAVVLIAYPGGIASALGRFRRYLARPERTRLHEFDGPVEIAKPEASQLQPLDAEGITVRFGGLVAVDRFSLQVGPSQIVGLIGPNGAGKTTLFNAISGLNEPTEGRVHIFGSDVSNMAVHKRALLGVGRTFQLIQLVHGLSVFDNVLVATHTTNTSGVFSHVLATKPSLQAERGCIERVWQIVHLLGLSEVAGSSVSDLPFGTLRMVELARALVSGAKLIMLDEPASGLDNAETEKLAGLLRDIRSKLGVAILLIEHDVRLVMSVSDYVYVIESGRLLAEGVPSEVLRNEAVIAAYLGTAPELAAAP